MIQYGFQRLVLLGSAGYSRAELPLDASVSLIAPNNTGKTSLINALQFLLIISKRRMDFGAHDIEKSQRFYFPHNSAYILLEVLLPNAGAVVLGCVGKGVSHDYEYFAYQGGLDAEDYRLSDGSLVAQPQLKQQLALRGKRAFSFTPSEFSEVLYGNRKKRQEHELDFTVFKLEHSSLAEVFQRVLTRTLRLDKLNSADVKGYLLAIFRRDLPDHSIDFKAEWDKAFAEVNVDRTQYQAALSQQANIAQLDRLQQERLSLRGKLIHFRPLIDAKLLAWDGHFRTRQGELQGQIRHLICAEKDLQTRDRLLASERILTQQHLAALRQTSARHQALRQQFALICKRAILEERQEESRQALNAQIALLQQATSRSADAIRRDQQTVKRELIHSQRELASLADNLYLRLKAGLPAHQLDLLNRLLNRQTMTLGKGQFTVEPSDLRGLSLELEKLAQTSSLQWRGLRIGLDSLTPQHGQRSPEEIQQIINELQQQFDALEQQLKTALALDKASQRLRELERETRAIEEDLKHYDELLALDGNEAQRKTEEQMAADKLARIEAEQAAIETESERLRQAGRNAQLQLDDLTRQHGDITRRRDNRGDDAPMFSFLAELPHQTWFGDLDFPLEQLAERLETYRRDAIRLFNLEGQLQGKLHEIHAGGLTKFNYAEGPEAEIGKMAQFAAHLPQEAETLENAARAAVVNVTACLRELRDGLNSFKSKMRDFNRLIGKRRLSDLKVFKIEPADETALVEAITHLISTAEQVDSGETFDLFNQTSVLDDQTLNRAKNLLIREGEARGCLRVEHLFRLEFKVRKEGREEESFNDIDSAASNGTVLMAKLVTGLALLHLMQDKRHEVQAVCYLDEASALDQRNQRSLIDTATEFGFALIFASPSPLVTARYCVPITSRGGANSISRQNWQILEPLQADA